MARRHTVGEFGAFGGKYSEWLNETGLVEAERPILYERRWLVRTQLLMPKTGLRLMGSWYLIRHLAETKDIDLNIHLCWRSAIVGLLPATLTCHHLL